MERAVVLIGVQQTGAGLARLPAVGDALTAMRNWAKAQGVTDDMITECSDLDGTKVTPADVVDAVKKYVARPTLDQLIVFFCGHGVVSNWNEFWLLSDAPVDANAAVNLARTIDLAAYGQVPHVVFMSDACRSAATTMAMQGVSGTVIFPNAQGGGLSRTVDVFYACRLGDAAHEVPDPADAANYHAVYTDVLTAGLSGQYDEAVESSTDGKLPISLVRPIKLKPAVQARMLQRLAELQAQFSVNQTPDARITGDDKAWLARFAPPLKPAPAPPPTKTRGSRSNRGSLEERVFINGSFYSMSGRLDRFPDVIAKHRRREPEDPSAAPLRQAIAVLMEPLDWGRVLGDKVLVRGGRIGRAEQGSAALALELETPGLALLLPRIDGRIPVVTVEDHQVIDVWYGLAGRDVPEKHAEVAARSRLGLGVSQPLPRQLHNDPTLAIYAAYDIVDRGRRTEVERVRADQLTRFGFSLYDLDLLTAEVTPTGPPGLPMLSRGWARIDGEPPLPHRPLQSLWTAFAPEVFPLLSDFINA